MIATPNELQPNKRTWLLRIDDKPVPIASFEFNPELGLSAQQEYDSVLALTEHFMESMNADAVLDVIAQHITH